MSANRAIKIRVLPGVFIKILNSLWRNIIILIQIIFIREGENQKNGGIINSPIKVLNQFKLKWKFLEGSNVLNKFAIIFRRICL